MHERSLPRTLRNLFGKLGSKLSGGIEATLGRFQGEPAWDVEPRLRSYEAMPETPLPSFEDEAAPTPAPVTDPPRLRRYFEALRELSHAVTSLLDVDDLTWANLFGRVDALMERQVPELADLAPPVMTILADSPDWRERRWAMLFLVRLGRLLPEVAGTFVPGFLGHIESPSGTERDLASLGQTPGRERLAAEFGFGDAVTISIELPVPVGEFLQDVALEGLDQLAMIVPDFAQDAFSVLETLADQPTRAGERASVLLERLRLGERMRRLPITEEFLAALRDPYVIAIARGKRFHLGHCRYARTSIGKEAYLFLNSQEAAEFGFVACQACSDS